jgi:predicted ferric reductase
LKNKIVEHPVTNLKSHFSRQPPAQNTATVKIAIIGVLLVFFFAALYVPFYFETMTLWYKVGIDKTLLRSGQVAGMSALVLIMLQIILAVPGDYLENLFGKAALARYHRTNGLVILLLAISHVALVLAPEGLTNLPIGKKYWPELIGFLVFSAIFITIIATYLRQPLKIRFENWRVLHKILGYCIIVLLPIHIIFVSDSFEYGPLRSFLIFIFGMLVLRVLLVKIFSHFSKL